MLDSIGNPNWMSIGNPHGSCLILLGVPTSTLANRIVAARQAKNLSQADFARLLGIKQPSLSDLESGESRRPSASTLLAMRDAGINPDFIMKNKGPILLAEGERSIREQTLVGMFRGMSEESRDTIEHLARVLRRTTGEPGPDDPFRLELPPKSDM